MKISPLSLSSEVVLATLFGDSVEQDSAGRGRPLLKFRGFRRGAVT